MELRQLRYFLAAARTLNFTKAAEEVHIAQPPLCRQINNLESELGVRLFERGSRSIALTPAGQFFQDRAVEILTRVERLKREAAAFSDNRARVFRLGFDVSVLYGRFPVILKFVRETYTDLDFEFVEVLSADQPQALRDGDIDFSIGRVLARDDQIEQVAVREEPLMLAVPLGHQAFAGAGQALRLNAMRNDTFILYAGRPSRRSLDPVVRLFELADFKPTKVVAVGDLPAALGLVASGVGVSVVPAAAVRMRPDDVRYALLEEAGTVSPIVLSTLRGANSAMLQMIVAEIKRLAALDPPPLRDHGTAALLTWRA